MQLYSVVLGCSMGLFTGCMSLVGIAQPEGLLGKYHFIRGKYHSWAFFCGCASVP